MRCIALSLHFLICLAPKLCKNCFDHSMFTLSFMFLLSYFMPSLCSHSQFILFWIWGSLLIVMAGFYTSFCFWFDIPSFLVILLFISFYDVCSVCYTFNIYLTTLFDVYCMLFWSIHCMHNLSTKWILHLASHGVTNVYIIPMFGNYFVTPAGQCRTGQTAKQWELLTELGDSSTKWILVNGWIERTNP